MVRMVGWVGESGDWSCWGSWVRGELLCPKR